MKPFQHIDRSYTVRIFSCQLFPFIVIITFSFIALLYSCNFEGSRRKADGNTLHIIHAGSLAYPVRQISQAFNEQYPGIAIRTEAWGSKAGARRIIDIDSPADLYLSADYRVIENMLIPDHASWYIPFATNELAIVFTAQSRYAQDINVDNWYEILLKDDVKIGRSDPDHDPCGVRSVFTCKLAGIYYQIDDLPEKLLSKDLNNIRPKETDLIALLETGHLDYIFLYKSVALQHKLNYLELPPELSLGDASLNDWYGQVSIQSLGVSPGTLITETGQAIIYGMTIPHKSQNKELAELFMAFILDKDKGQKILESLGQPKPGPMFNPYYELIPEKLKAYYPMHGNR